MLFVPSGTVDAAMSDYCQVPPYVVQNIPPNVLILFDVSGSMLNFAYSDGYQTPTDATDDHSCTSTDRCTQYNYSGRLASHRYYGYFDPDSGTPTAPMFHRRRDRGRRRDPDHYWDGNFLNWLTMRRIDVMRKVLTGGRPNGRKIDGLLADDRRPRALQADPDKRPMRTPPISTRTRHRFRLQHGVLGHLEVRRHQGIATAITLASRSP